MNNKFIVLSIVAAIAMAATPLAFAQAGKVYKAPSGAHKAFVMPPNGEKIIPYNVNKRSEVTVPMGTKGFLCFLKKGSPNSFGCITLR